MKAPEISSFNNKFSWVSEHSCLSYCLHLLNGLTPNWKNNLHTNVFFTFIISVFWTFWYLSIIYEISSLLRYHDIVKKHREEKTSSALCCMTLGKLFFSFVPVFSFVKWRLALSQMKWEKDLKLLDIHIPKVEAALIVTTPQELTLHKCPVPFYVPL